MKCPSLLAVTARAIVAMAALLMGVCAVQGGAPADYFEVQVVDDATGRGVPLAEIRTVHKVSFWTDSHGVVAFHEPGLMGREVYFHVSSPGYEIPADAFGFRGVRLTPALGGRAVVRMKRLNIAERLYRVTGAGIYADTTLLGRRPPTQHPLLNGLVLGQDTVVATPYRGKIYWFWGDTDRLAYPLGNFAASGATSVPPPAGGLDPGVGVDLEYFVDARGFCRPMCPRFGQGLHWIESVMTVPDADGVERLAARVSSQEGLTPAYAWHLAVWDDTRNEFESRVTWYRREGHDAAHPFRARVGDRDFLYLYPNYRVPADLESLANLDRYEAYTCIDAEGGGFGAVVDRDAQGRVRYAWRRGGERLHPGRVRELVRQGMLQPSESWLALRDVDSGAAVPDGRGSVFWNVFRQRWVMVVSGAPGDVWFAEADTPVGPWLYARRVVTHGDYNFYNPTQHPFFDQEDGRVIYFEGTYTMAFSAAKAPTPRYDYNQIMYRLSLDDPRLSLPAPVYRLDSDDSGERLLLREKVSAEAAWGRIREVAFFAVPPSRPGEGLIPIYAVEDGSLALEAPTAGATPLFLACPPDGEVPGFAAADLVPLVEERRVDGRRPRYRAGIEARPDSAPGVGVAVTGSEFSGRVLCRVWANRRTALTLDAEAVPKP